MSLLELIGRPDVVAGALLVVISAAGGINLYATLATLGIGSRLGLIPALPPGLSGLENGLVLGTAGVLLLVEAAADREHAFAGMWHTLHSLVKPLAAGLLAASALAGRSPETMMAACVVAAFTALLFHAMRYGARIARRLPDAPRGGALVTLGEAALAVALLVPLRYPLAAAPTALGLLLVGAIGGPLGYRAFRLGIAAQRARLRLFLGETGWLGLDEVPRGLRRLVPATPLGGTPPRVARVAMLQAPGLGRFTRGWLVSGPDGERLLGWSLRGPRAVRLTPGAKISVRPGSWADAVRIDTAAEELQILLLKDGPAPALVARALAAEPLSGRRVESSSR